MECTPEERRKINRNSLGFPIAKNFEMQYFLFFSFLFPVPMIKEYHHGRYYCEITSKKK